MKPDEQKKAITMLAKLFPNQVNDEHARILRGAFAASPLQRTLCYRACRRARSG